MPNLPEREPQPQGVEERPEEISPLTIEKKEVVQPTPSQFQAQIKSDTGQPLIQTPANQAVTIQIPADQTQLKRASQGSITAALTWFARFWLRMIKKAIHFGWKIIAGTK